MEGVLKPDENGLSYASLSCPSLIMSILQYCPDCKQHAQFVETLMRYKSNVCLDILAVLAYGPQPVINSAGQVLLHYYPLKDVGMFGYYETPFINYACRFQDKDRLQVVPHFSSGIVGRVKYERAWKSPHARKAILPAAHVVFSHVGWFSRALAFHSLYYPWGKMGDYL